MIQLYEKQSAPPNNKPRYLTYLIRLWHSSTFTTWMSFAVYSLHFVVITPLVMANFSQEIVAVWLLFALLMNLGNLLDIGFFPTFSRVISYVMGGASVADELHKQKTSSISRPTNWTFMEDVYSSVGKVYIVLTVCYVLLFGLLGAAALNKPISVASNIDEMWISWSVICVCMSYVFFGKKYASVLHGMNYIALVNRWKVLFGLLGIGASLAVIIAGKSILYLVISSQLFKVANVVRDRFLLMRVEKGKFRQFRMRPFNREIFLSTWKPAWRSGLGILFSMGVTQTSGIIYSQIADAGDIAAYLFALKLITAISQISQAPFYSKIPIFARLRAEGRITELTAKTSIAMGLSLIVFVIGVLSIGFLAGYLLEKIGSQTSFIDRDIWALMSLVFFFERHHAMHAQIYSTTNHIPFYIPIGISGSIFLLASLVFVSTIGVWIFPIAQGFSNLIINNWWNVKISLRSINSSFWRYYKKSALAPSAILFMGLFIFLIFI